MLLFLPVINALAQTREEIEAAKQAALLKTIGYVAIGVVVLVLLITAVWLLVLKKDKNGKVRVKTYSPQDTYSKREGRGGFNGGF
ncbi:hypothetical protein BKI52_23520 [marine bacterium AO1-C]|nr:hypothetical protein BKI52_23520 [marine bacterium AO1-C]